MYIKNLLILIFILLLKIGAITFAIFYSEIELGPDEAQYWTWSQSLDWGYYSKPPGIAWEIWLGTTLFGNTEFGVRSVPLLLGCLIPLSVFYGAKNCRLTPSACLWAALCMAITPIGILSSFLAITDGGMILFWMLSCLYLAKVIEAAKTPNYIYLGVLILCGALFKWPIYSLWLFVIGAWAFFPKMISWRILNGIAVSLMALLPSLYWNFTHEWATFKHVLTTLNGGHGHAKIQAFFKGNFWEFMGAQAALISPLIFFLLLMTFYSLIKNRKNVPKGALYFGGISLSILIIGSFNAIFMKMQGNWAIFAYPTAFVALAWYCCEWKVKLKKWLIGGIVLSVLLCTASFSFPFLQSHNTFADFPIPYKISPFRHNVGWNHLEELLEKAGYHPTEDFLFADKYQMASILSFYGPEQKRAYFLNLQGTRKNQFSFWPGIEMEQKGKKGFFVVSENIPQLNLAMPTLKDFYQERLTPYFKDVRFIGVHPIFHAYEKVVKGILIFECTNYNGALPLNPNLY